MTGNNTCLLYTSPREISSGVTYVEPPAHYYENYFKNMVGVTHPANAEVVNAVSYTHLAYRE